MSTSEMESDPEVNWIDFITPTINQEDTYICGVVNVLGVCEFQFIHDDKIGHPENFDKSKLDYKLSVKEIVDRLYEFYPRPADTRDRLGFQPTKLDIILEYIQRFGVSMDSDWPMSTTFTEKPNESQTVWVVKWKHGYYSEAVVKEILNIQPIVGGCLAYPSFIHYKGGLREIYRGPQSDEINWVERQNLIGENARVIPHAVLIFGYGTDTVTKEKYFLVRNTYGSNWGENGLGRVLISVFEGYFACSSWISYPRDVVPIETEEIGLLEEMFEGFMEEV